MTRKLFLAMWFAYFAFCYQNPEKMLFVEQFLYSGYIEDSIYNKIEEMVSPLDQFLIEGQKNGLIKQIDVELLKAQMEGALHEIVKILMMKRKSLDKMQLQKCFDMAWDSIKQ